MNSCASSFKKIEMVVPRLSVLPRGSFTIGNEADSDSQIWCSSSLRLDVHDQQLDEIMMIILMFSSVTTVGQGGQLPPPLLKNRKQQNLASRSPPDLESESSTHSEVQHTHKYVARHLCYGESKCLNNVIS